MYQKNLIELHVLRVKSQATEELIPSIFFASTVVRFCLELLLPHCAIFFIEKKKKLPLISIIPLLVSFVYLFVVV